MKIQKQEIAKRISQLKSVVPKICINEALHGLLVKDGYLIASNGELTVKANLEGVGVEQFIIPDSAFDLINNLPDGEVEITGTDHDITIHIGDISNKFSTLSPNKFSFSNQSIKKDLCSVPAEKLIAALKHTIYAALSTGSNQMMNGVYMDCKNGNLNIVSLDGKRIAYDSISCEGTFQLIIPRTAIDKLLGLTLKGDIEIGCDKNGAMFKSKEFEVYTRLIDGNYYDYDKMFGMKGELNLTVHRKDLLDAVTRASICGALSNRQPVLLSIKNDRINIGYNSANANYSEDIIATTGIQTPIEIAFDSKVVSDCMKSFGDLDTSDLNMFFSNSKSPVVIYPTEGSEMKSLILPVNIARA